MWYRWLIVLELLLIVAIAVLLLAGCPRYVTIGGCGVAAILLILIFWCVHAPLYAVEKGIYILRSQEYSNRLVKVGNPDADRVVDFFNSLMNRLKEERLRLQEQNGFLSKIMKESPMGIAVCDFDGNIARANPAFNRLASQTVTDAFKAIKRGESVVIRNGATDILRLSRHYFMDSGFQRDFLLIERLTDEIISAEKRVVNLMVRTISHELNNSIGAVASLLETLYDIHRNEASPLPSVIESSHKSCLNLSAFIRRYAELAKIPEPNLVEVDLTGYFEELMPQFLRMAEPFDVEICLRCDKFSGSAMMDPALMERVMTNIVLNAIESRRSEGKSIVEIVVKHDMIMVIDNGKGISPDVADRIFTPFFSTKHADRGIGLMLVADILRLHKFNFSLTTDTATRLTTFAIRLRRS